MQIKPYEKNAKKHPTEQIEKIKKSIETFGFLQPLVIDKEGTIIVGHGRYLAAQKLGITEIREASHAQKGETFIPYVLVENLTPEEVKAYRLADNKLNETDWNIALVIEELKNLEAEGMDIEITGFDHSFLEQHAADFKEQQKRNLQEEYIIPPFSIWDTKQVYWQKRKQEWLTYFGDSGEGREDNLLTEGLKKLALRKSSTTTLTGTSIFDPVVAEVCYRWFGIDKGSVLDPFAGGCVRGIVAAVQGKDYYGVDLSKKQIQANVSKAAELDLHPHYYQGNSLTIDTKVPVEEVDFIFSCPPYYDLEEYNDGEGDLSMKSTYQEFLEDYRAIIKKSVDLLKENRFAVFVVGDIRSKEGYYQGFVKDTIEAFENAGAKFYNDIILVNALATAPLRARGAFESSRKVCKVHQNILAFYKGNTEEIKDYYQKLPQIHRWHDNVVVFYKGDIEEIKKNYKVIPSHDLV